MTVDWVLVMAVGTWAMVLVMAIANWRIIRQNRSLVVAAGEQMNQSILQTELMRLQFQSMMKAIERPKIIELAKYILNPFISQLDTVTESFKRSKIGFPRRLTVWEDEGLIDDLERRRPGIKLMVEEHNKDSEILNAKINDLKRTINTPEFREKCFDLIGKYNLPKKRLLEDPSSYMEQLTYFVIQDRKDFDDISGQLADFWRTYGSELLKMREKEGIQNAIKEIEDLCDRYIGRHRCFEKNWYN